MNLEIRRFEMRDAEPFQKATEAWDGSPGFTWTRPNVGQTFAEWLELTRQEEAGIGLAPGRVPATVLAAFLDGELVARASLRHHLNDFLSKVGGHIGYGVIPAYRRRGLATRVLEASLVECRRLGLERVLVTCSVDNVGSAKTIEKNGGVFENLYSPEDGSGAKRRYWITLG